MPALTQKNILGDLLKYEAPSLYSREQAVVASGQNLRLGTVVGRVTATGKLKALNPDASDPARAGRSRAAWCWRSASRSAPC